MSVDRREELDNKLKSTFRVAAQYDRKYIQSMDKYRQRVSDMNLVSRQDLAQTNKQLFQIRTDLVPRTNAVKKLLIA